MTDEDTRYYAKSMSELQRRAIVLCAVPQSWGYTRLAEKLGVTYAEARSAGDYLQATNLARIEHVRHGSEFPGSAIFLNERGEQVRSVVERLGKRKN